MALQAQFTQQPQVTQQRQAIRHEIRQRRRTLSPQQQQSDAKLLVTRVTEHPRIQAAQHLALYLSFDGELDTGPLIKQLWQLGKQVYLPVLHPFSPGNLLFLHYTEQTVLVENRFHILEPVLDVRNVLPLSQLAVVLTPLVAFDSQGGRLGMGGGFYDRTLQHWQRGGPYPIGLAHDCQQVSALPVESWDIALPEIITPAKCWAWHTG
ncbi:5-formyltetrahydrofolate cyclo-ligase [Serratia sp. DD3]|uniref:5-formyltetrahydrofolate cyclo-ligase n=1 Tax=Serratia sp. DD3 TaxID=1410619 RepID=UPI0003C51BB7|nr:5-formyltetrahydrofolate cyclo-ligase [Serratia sp. DD3]KEY59270.1 putative 5-formyltetrahydrofolate cyclo-ligase [Serratia sp. DD3]